MNSILELMGVTKSYKHNEVVSKLSFSVAKGEVFALLGANGAGKTTTIKMILGLAKQDDGEIKMPEDVRIGYSPETPYFPPYLTGREVLKYYAGIQKEKMHNEEYIGLLKFVGLEDSGTRVRDYSKGMLQRLALAQALIGNPELLILDEPTAGLDTVGRMQMIKLLSQFKHEGKTIIINSHILSDVEKICDRGIIMKSGMIMKEWNSKREGTENLEKIFLRAVGEQ